MEEINQEQKEQQFKKNIHKFFIIVVTILLLMIILFVFDQQTQWLSQRADQLISYIVGK
ncbi:MAG: hypothetical protein KAS12_03650 [Candidatus Aenigmarchaeota archaeon]|nr:hypothetical protein [Candidatus Aenigmarchaeota archaeon]